MGLTSSPPASEMHRGSDSSPQPQDYNPRTFVYSEEAHHLLDAPATTWDSRDFSDEETSIAWWGALVAYGAILLTFGALTELGFVPAYVLAIVGALIGVFVGLAVLAYAGLEAGVAVFAAGWTLVGASRPGLIGLSGDWWWTQFLILIGGAMCLGAGFPMTWFGWKDLADDEPALPMPAV